MFDGVCVNMFDGVCVNMFDGVCVNMFDRHGAVSTCSWLITSFANIADERHK